MYRFDIHPVDRRIQKEIEYKIDHLAKPKGSLGVLEETALQISLIQQTLTPQLKHPHNILFAGDHGVAEEGVSFTPKEVTWQQTINFTRGGTAINFLCDQHHFQLKVVDAGVDYDFPPALGIIDRKVGRGTRNYCREAAMSIEEMDKCIRYGAEVVSDCHRQGCNIVSFGEMGVANTSASSLWMHLFTKIPLRQCVGAGSGLSNSGVEHKYAILARALDRFGRAGSPQEVIRNFGGYEMVMAVGAMLQAAELKMVIIIDGFIMTACLLAAARLCPAVRDYAIFGHCGDEAGHRMLLDYLDAHPILNLGLRLGEGTGAVCSYPIIQSAVIMMNEMNSFESASIRKYH